jgi:hypothetical protein
MEQRMSKGKKDTEVSTIGDIRIYLTSTIKGWRQQTTDLLWPEDDSSLADMDVHIGMLSRVNAQLALAETSLSPAAQKALLSHFDKEAIQDPCRFASFATAVGTAIAA